MALNSDETSSERLDRIKQMCELLGLDREQNVKRSLAFTADHLLVDDKHQAIYCYVPKAGCTSWKSLMMRLASGLDNNTFSQYRSSDFHSVTAQRKLGLYPLSDYSNKGQAMRLANYFKFMVTRDPFSRLVSGYNDKFRKRERLFRGPFGRELHREIKHSSGEMSFPEDDKRVTFKEFIEYVNMMYTESHQNGHWHSITEWCQPCLIAYDYVAKTETMARDAEEILAGIGTPRAIKYMPHYNTHHYDDIREYYDQVPKEQLDALLDLYRNDTLLFGYRIPSFI